ncbi:AI-2E family transporter [bacterium]|nr:MAG: AI-2E family transporter [bacterium]
MSGGDRFGSEYRKIGLTILVIVLGALAFGMVRNFVPALLWATTVSILASPLYERMRKRLDRTSWLKGDRAATISALLATLLTGLIFCIPFIVIGVGIATQASSLAQEVQNGEMVKQIDKAVQPLAERFGMAEFEVSHWFTENREQITQSLRAPATDFARGAGTMLLTLVIALLTQFFMLRDSHRLLDPVLDLLPFARERGARMFDRIAETVRAVFVGTVLVAVLQGLVIGVAYYFTGVPNALLLGVVSAILCIIPLLGAPVVYLPVGLFLIGTGKVNEGLIILGVGFLIVSQIDNALKPFLIGGRANLHPMAIFFAILGGIAVVGPIGLMAGPMLLTALLALQDVIRERLQGVPPDGEVVGSGL